MSAEDGGKETEERRKKGLGKGTIRLLADSISVQDAERASKQVQEAIAQQQHQLDDLTRYLDANKSLCRQVLHLPDSVSHQIMVPFGKAAFFPGRLVHTNEFMVLLGESFYAERSAKQTAEILNRRGQFLNEKIADATAHIADLHVESSFISNAADEAKAGLVEIREEYDVSEDLQNPASAVGFSRNAIFERVPAPMTSTSASSSSRLTEDTEHDRLMARLSELELAEAAAGEDSEDEEGHDDEAEGDPLPFRSSLHRTLMHGKGKVSGSEESGSEETDVEGEREFGSSGDDEEDSDEDAQLDLGVEGVVRTKDDHGVIDQPRGFADKDADESLKRALLRFGREVSFGKGSSISQHGQRESTPEGVQTSEAQVLKESLKEPEKADIAQDVDYSNKGVREWRNDGDHRKGHVLAERQGSDHKSDVSSVKERTGNLTDEETAAPHAKAFTGQVTEHGYAAGTSSKNQQVQKSQPSRPVSKFKMRQAQAGRR